MAKRDEACWAVPDGLSDRAVRAYGCLADAGAIGRTELGRRCEFTAAESAAALRELRAVGLVADAGQGRFAAVPPAVASLRLIAPRERALRAEARRLEGLREAFDALQPGGAPAGTGAPVPLPDRATVGAAVADLVAGCAVELAVCRPGGVGGPAFARQALGHAAALRARGIRVRVLCQHAARFAAAAMADLERLAAAGAEVATVSGELPPLVTVDGRRALIARPGGGAVLVSDPATVAFVTGVVDRAWAASDPYGDPAAAPAPAALSGKVRASIVRLLADGHSDKAIARRLGISERTCQRHVADVFGSLGARSRFHAGYLIGRAGHAAGAAEPAVE